MWKENFLQRSEKALVKKTAKVAPFQVWRIPLSTANMVHQAEALSALRGIDENIFPSICRYGNSRDTDTSVNTILKDVKSFFLEILKFDI